MVRDERPDVVGVTATTPLVNQARDLSYVVRAVDPAIITVLGGSHASALPEETLRQSAFHAVARGETDFVIADLLDGTPLREVRGLHVRDGDDVVATGPAGLLDDLDALPMPAWEDYPVEATRSASKLVARHQPVTSIEFSRGCIYSCDFCASKQTLGRGYRKKSPERCADELERLASLGFREAVLHDDIFTTDVGWAKEVCEAIIRRDLDIAWTCSNGIRVDAADRELFTLMARAGCYRVYFGFETGNADVLSAFGKGGQATLEQGVVAVDLARRAGLEPNGFFMVGLQHDTTSSMADTIDYARRMRLDAMKCGICVPYPGTPMFQDLHAAGRLKTLDWDAYTVYNKAASIFDHPTLTWPEITDAFDRFYRDVILRNPSYLLRRLRYLLRNGEIRENLGFARAALRLRRPSGDVAPLGARYAHADEWRPLDLVPSGPLTVLTPPTARRRGTVAPSLQAALAEAEDPEQRP